MRFRLAIIVALCVLCCKTSAQSVTYFKGDVYAALGEAQKVHKLLMVEFFAQWSYKSRWMNENVISKSKDLNNDFVLCQIDTRSVNGAALANDYQVTDYPNILIFNANGNVIDRIDKTLSLDDFEARISQTIAATDGRNAWQLAQILDAANRADKDGADRLMAQYIADHKPPFLTTPQHWNLFTNSDITFYGSTGYWFLKDNISLFPAPEKVDEVLRRIYVDAIMPYVIGSKGFDSIYVNALGSDGAKFKEVVQLAQLAQLRSEKDYYTYVQLLGNVVDVMAEQYEYPLIMSLDFVADGVDDNTHKSIKRAAATLIEKLYSHTTSPVKISLIESLLDKFL